MIFLSIYLTILTSFEFIDIIIIWDSSWNESLNLRDKKPVA